MHKYILLFFVCMAGISLGVSEAFAQGAALSFSPAAANVSLGSTFWVTVMVDTQGQNVNAVAAYFTYPQDKLDVVEVNTADSVMTLVAEKNAGNGKVEISGGRPTPGFAGVQKIAAVLFRAKAASGTAELVFTSGSAILTDTTNTNILNLSASGKGTYSMVKAPSPPPVSAPVAETKPLSPPAQEEPVAAKERENRETITIGTFSFILPPRFTDIALAGVLVVLGGIVWFFKKH